jgi:hypothetical protein
MTVNKHGLSRDIPAEVKRSIRKSCGFGCVICGLAIVEYEHVDPEFSEATVHDPECMTLLCPQCHSKVTTGFWSKSKVTEAMKDPACFKSGFSREVFDLGSSASPKLTFGGMTFLNCPTPIQIAGLALFSIESPEESEGPFRLSGHFTDSTGNLSLSIFQNEWIASVENWDVKVTGQTIAIREKQGKINLRLIADPPASLVVDKLDMKLAEYLVLANKDSLVIKLPDGRTSDFTGCIIDGCEVGIAFEA